MSCSNRILENNSAEGNLDNGGTIQEDPEESKVIPMMFWYSICLSSACVPRT